VIERPLASGCGRSYNLRDRAAAHNVPSERAFIVSGGGVITPEHLPPLRRRVVVARPAEAADSDAPRTLEEVEIEHLLRVLEKHSGSKTAAAAELGISLKTIYNKLNKLNDRRAAG